MNLPLAVRIGVALSVLHCGAATGQDAGIELLHRMQNALGGVTKLSSIHDFDQSVTANTWDRHGRPLGQVRKRVRWIKPNLLRLDQVGPYDTYVLYFDGNAGWEVPPDGHLADLTGGEKAFAEKYLSGFELNLWLADRLPNYQVSSPAQNIVRISSRNNAHQQTEIALDPSSWLPTKESSVSLADPAHPVPSETLVKEWMAVQGVNFPRRVWVLHGGIRLADIETKAIALNSRLNPTELARKPSNLKPDMGDR
jgi:hypothetical protein